MTAKPWEWGAALDLATVRRIFGEQHFAYCLTQGAGYCDGRAAGWWQANDAEYFNAYTSLARMIRAGEVRA